jgi:hypothetical protein
MNTIYRNCVDESSIFLPLRDMGFRFANPYGTVKVIVVLLVSVPEVPVTVMV